jgi:hypothetical protein
MGITEHRSGLTKETGRVILTALVALVATSALPGSAAAQPPATKPAQPAAEAPALSARYRFQEKYVLKEDPEQPAALSQYKVGSRETVKITLERPQGAPEVEQTVLQTVYADRVAKVNRDGLLSEVVRRYDGVRLTSTLQFTAYKTPPIEGLVVLYRLQNRSGPQILSLTDRQFRQREFEQISYQAFLPVLATVLPRKAVRQGDTWPVNRLSLWALVGALPFEEDLQVSAELHEVRNDESGKGMMAVIDVKGDFQVEQGPSQVNAEIYFRFHPAQGVATAATAKDSLAEPKAGAGREPSGIHDAPGHIAKVRMAQIITSAQPGGDGRLKQTVERQLVLDRRTPAEGSGGAPAPDVPNPPPTANMRNSWLLYDDPQQRFHLLYPQEFGVRTTYPEGGIDLVDRRPDGQDVIQVNLVPKGDDPRRDRLAADPLQEKRALEEDWRKNGEKVLPGPSGWLPDADWTALKRKVYRIEAALVPKEDSGPGPAPAGGRIYMDRYIVQFAQNQVLRVTAMTTRDPHIAFRDMAESLIRTFEFGPSKDVMPAASTAAPAAAAGARSPR